VASYNRVILVGNLTRDIELRHIGSGTAVTDIGLAVNDRVKRGDQWVEEATFVDVTLWGRTAEVANQYLSRGAPVLIEGRLKTESWEKDGKKFTKLKVVGDSLQMLGSRQEKPSQKPQGVDPYQTKRALKSGRDGDEAPF